MTRNIFVALTIILNIFQSASAGVINVPSSRNLSTTNNNYCTDNEKWIGSGTQPADCISAVQHLYYTEVGSRRTPKTTDYEFLTPRVLPPRSGDYMRTPRKYTVGRFWHFEVQYAGTKTCSQMEAHVLSQS